MDLAKQLAYNYIFRGLPRHVVAGFAATAAIQRHGAGDVIMRQFESEDDLYVLLEGSAIIRDYRGELLAELGPGSVMGEIALVDHHARSATVVATEAVVAAVIPALVIRGVMDEDDGIRAALMTNISKLLCMRLRSTSQRATCLEEPLAARGKRARSA